MAELSGAMGDISDIFNLDGNFPSVLVYHSLTHPDQLGPQMQLLTQQLEDQGSQYCNSQAKDEQCQTWTWYVFLPPWKEY